MHETLREGGSQRELEREGGEERGREGGRKQKGRERRNDGGREHCPRSLSTALEDGSAPISKIRRVSFAEAIS